MNLASYLANICFEFLLHCEGKKGFGPSTGSGQKAGQSFPPAQLPHPPGALAPAEFREKCDRCGACLDRCPNAILLVDTEGFPVVDFARGACIFCGACAESCTRGAFSAVGLQVPWAIKAVIADTCLTRQNVLCRTCGEHCPAGAIEFPRQAGGISEPRIIPGQCNGCGACFSPCPTRAICMEKWGAA